MSPNRVAKSLEILNLITVKAVINLMAGSCSQSKVAAFRSPVAFEMEISMYVLGGYFAGPPGKDTHSFSLDPWLAKLNPEAVTWHNSFSWQIGMLHCQLYSCKWHLSIEGGKIYISPQQFSAVSLWMAPTWSSKDGKSVNTYHNELGLVCFLHTLHHITASHFGWQDFFLFWNKT